MVRPAGDVIAAAYDTSEALRLTGSLYAVACGQAGIGGTASAPGGTVGWWCGTSHYIRSLILQGRVCDLLGNAAEALAAFKEASMLVRAGCAHPRRLK